jgi:hypothetical protein
VAECRFKVASDDAARETERRKSQQTEPDHREDVSRMSDSEQSVNAGICRESGASGDVSMHSPGQQVTSPQLSKRPESSLQVIMKMIPTMNMTG